MDSHTSRWTVAALLLIAASLAVALASCRERSAPRSYVEALRCGMTRTEVTKLAHEHGYSGSDRNWLARTAARKSSEELQLVDLTFRQGRLVGYKQTSYDPRTRRNVSRTVDLCMGGH